ncbi:MAG: type II toxin-antitoxin system Phd/YefM family antitoxin [Phycisphaerae bacterium]
MQTTDIRTSTELQANLKADLRHVRETGRPMFITEQGQTAGVLLSPSVYSDMEEKAKFADDIAAIRRGLDDVKNGRAVPFDDAMREIAAKYNISLES